LPSRSPGSVRPLQQNGYTNTLRERLHALATLGVTPDRIYVFVIAKGATDEPVGSIGLWQHKICECRCGTPGWRTTRLGAGDPM
jgi:hypothetical protein